MSEACASVMVPASWSWLRRRHSVCIAVTLPSMWTSLSWMSWNAAMGRPNCARRVA